MDGKGTDRAVIGQYLEGASLVINVNIDGVDSSMRSVRLCFTFAKRYRLRSFMSCL